MRDSQRLLTLLSGLTGAFGLVVVAKLIVGTPATVPTPAPPQPKVLHEFNVESAVPADFVGDLRVKVLIQNVWLSDRAVYIVTSVGTCAESHIGQGFDGTQSIQAGHMAMLTATATKMANMTGRTMFGCQFEPMPAGEPTTETEAKRRESTVMTRSGPTQWVLPPGVSIQGFPR